MLRQNMYSFDLTSFTSDFFNQITYPSVSCKIVVTFSKLLKRYSLNQSSNKGVQAGIYLFLYQFTGRFDLQTLYIIIFLVCAHEMVLSNYLVRNNVSTFSLGFSHRLVQIGNRWYSQAVKNDSLNFYLFCQKGGKFVYTHYVVLPPRFYTHWRGAGPHQKIKLMGGVS